MRQLNAAGRSNPRREFIPTLKVKKMRTKFVAGNWKMNKTVAEARELVSIMGKELKNISNVEKVLCPPFMSLVAVANLIGGTDLGLGAQNMHWEEKGAYTGETSPGMIKEFCQYVILGHSERRAYFGETDETVNKKLLAAQKHGLTPIVCVGETLAENEAGRTAEVVRRHAVRLVNDHQVPLGLPQLSKQLRVAGQLVHASDQ